MGIGIDFFIKILPKLGKTLESSPGIVLDNQIRDYVLFPIMFVMILVSVLRSNITLLMKQEPKRTLRDIQEAQTLLRSKRLRTFGNSIDFPAYLSRKAFFIHPEEGCLVITSEGGSTNPLMNPGMMDPGNMKGMLMGNLAMIIPQIGMMGWINLLFYGFVMVKLPFPLTLAFKTMLQRGIELSTLDVSYVSSLSFYFMAFLGIRGLVTVLTSDAVDDTAMMYQQQMGTMPGMGPQTDFTQLYKSEAEKLAVNDHQWVGENIEKRLLKTSAPPKKLFTNTKSKSKPNTNTKSNKLENKKVI